MKNLINIIIFISLCSYLQADDTLGKNYHFGATIVKYNKIRQNKIKSVVKRISKQFEELNDAKYKVDVNFIESSKDLVDGYVNYSKYNAIITYASFFLKDREKLTQASKYFFTFDYNKDFQKYILIVNKDANINSIKDIKNKRFASFITNDNYSDWLDYLSLKASNTSYKKLIKEEVNVQKDSTLVLDVYFKKADFAVVRKNVFKDIVSLNPAIEKKVMILQESEAIFLFGVGMFHKNVSNELIANFDKVISDGTFDNEYKNLIKMLGHSKIKRVYPKDFKKLIEFYEEYTQLKKKR